MSQSSPLSCKGTSSADFAAACRASCGSDTAIPVFDNSDPSMCSCTCVPSGVTKDVKGVLGMGIGLSVFMFLVMVGAVVGIVALIAWAIRRPRRRENMSRHVKTDRAEYPPSPRS